MTSFATHLECSRCQEDFPVDQIAQVCTNDGGPLFVRYDLVRAKAAFPKHGFSWREQTLWQYRELMYFLAWRDIAVRYKQTMIGVAWALIRPALTNPLPNAVAILPAPRKPIVSLEAILVSLTRKTHNRKSKQRLCNSAPA